MIEKIGNRWKDEVNALREWHFLIKHTIIFSAVYFVALSAIFRSNFLYHDDMARALEGYSRWGFSRHLSNFLSQFLHADTYLTDISPLPQIIAVFFISLASAIAVHMITSRKKLTFWMLVSALPIGLSPYFLECLSFKYDSTYMAMSVLFSVIPLLFCKRSAVCYLLINAISTIVMCTSYQASSGIFPMLVIVVGLCNWVRGEKTVQVLTFYALSAAGYLLGLVVFNKFMMREFVAYASTNIAPLSEILPCAIYNYKRYIVHFIEGFKPEWLAISFLICVLFLGTMVIRSKQNKALTFIVVGPAMILLFMLSFGVYPFLEEPLICPRAMYGIGSFIAFQGIYASVEPSKGYASKLACLILSWSFFVFAFTYGNALSVQAQYTDFRITEAIDDVLECDALSSDEEVTLQITGTIGYSPVLDGIVKEFPMIKKLVPVTFQGDGWWGEYGIRYYYKLPIMKFAETYDPPEEYMPIIIDNYYHTIRADEDYIWIDLH